MVKVRDTHFFDTRHAPDPSGLLEILHKGCAEAHVQSLNEAFGLVLQGAHNCAASDETTEQALRACIEVAEILAEMQLDPDAILAGFLCPASAIGLVSNASIRNHFGNTVATLIDGVSRMEAISLVKSHESAASAFARQNRQQEKIRRMLVAMIDDVRVALIKIAERSQALHSAKDRPDRTLIAREVFEVYAPLAHRLGIGQLKWELEDLAFRYLQPNDYRHVADLLAQRRIERQEYIEDVIDELRDALQVARIDSEVQGRAKHIYSIWRKMKRKGVSFTEIYDVQAVRILVGTIADCYTVLGIVHGKWRNVPQEFDDYIAVPKPNGYRSLHTAVYGPGGHVLEIQIRTHEMHQEAELGVCSHWRYKGTDQRTDAKSYEDKVSWLREVLDWHENLSDAPEQLPDRQLVLAEDRVYVFTPNGHVVDLPNGATPVDFAYAIHSEVGHSCRGAKVDGRIVPLTYKLSIGERVEIIKGTLAVPSRNWLRTDLGFVCTARARTKIQHWFRQQDREKNLGEGRAVLEREFRRLALKDVDLAAVAAQFNLSDEEALFVAIGAGDISLQQVLRSLQSEPPAVAPARRRDKRRAARGGDRFHICGVGNLLSSIAGCCKPVPGDSIIGYVTVGRGVSIHRQDCRKLLQLKESDAERIIAVEWSEEPNIGLFAADIQVEAYDRSGLLRDITALLANERINVLSVNTRSDSRKGVAFASLTIEVASIEILGRVLTKIEQITNVISARRVVADK